MLRETACLSRQDRAAVDREIAGDSDRIECMGDREVANEASKLAYQRDPVSFVQRRRKAEAERHTSLRPAPDVMTWFTALLPVKDGVAVHAALSAGADRLRAAADERSRGQIMADTLVQRVLAPHLGRRRRHTRCARRARCPSWSARPRPGPRHTIETTTPTGHTYVSVAPRLRPESKLSPAEIGLVEMIWAA